MNYRTNKNKDNNINIHSKKMREIIQNTQNSAEFALDVIEATGNLRTKHKIEELIGD